MILALPVLVCLPFAVVWFVMWRAPRRDALFVRRVPVSHAPLLTATLTRSHRELPGRPSAASTTRPVYLITDAKEVIRDGP